MKIYCLDTSVIIENPKIITDLGESEIIIPFCVLNEVDGHRKKPGVLGRNAREAIRNINAIIGDEDISKGVETEDGGILRFLRSDFERETIDLKIIACAEWIKAHEGEDPVLLSNDIGLRILARTKGIKSEEHKNTGPNVFGYTGTGEITLPESMITQIHERGYVRLQEDCNLCDDDFYQNQMFIIKSEEKNSSTLAKFERYEDQSAFVKINKTRPWDVAPANIEQTFALDMLMNPDTDLVTMIGKAGTGKTFLATAAGLDQVFDLGLYERIVLLRPIVEVGQGIGFLPGPQPLDAKILTPTGWTTMGQIKVGDYVIGRNGKPTKVLKIIPQGEKEIFKIKTTEGMETEACGDHLWLTRTTENIKRKKEGSVKTTKQIIDTLYREPSGKKQISENSRYGLGDLRPNHFLPRNEMVEFEKQDLKISPYVLGSILGDGSISNTISVSNVDFDIIDRIRDETSHLCDLVHNKDTIIYTFSGKYKNNKPSKGIRLTNIVDRKETIFETSGDCIKELNINGGTLFERCSSEKIVDEIKYEYIPCTKKWQNPIKEELRVLGLEGTKCHTKYIPDSYKYSSIEDRIALLQGLMDTDGTVKDNGESSFCTTSKQLAKDIIEVVRSLGGRAILPKPRNRIGNKSKIGEQIVESKLLSYEFTISFDNDVNPFFCKRKSEKYVPRKFIHNNGILSIKEAGIKECQCILVEDPEHLYITDDYIVTHNTEEEKLEPWIRPFKDNLMVLFNQDKKTIDMHFEKRKIVVEAMSYIRGRSIPNSFIIVDEAQNLTVEELKTILTRAAHGSKIVLTGDIEQIDVPKLDAETNGLSRVIEAFKDEAIAGHITMTKGQRSELATISAEIL